MHPTLERGSARGRRSLLARVRDALRAMYGDNIDRIVLFGSRARGDAREDSDYDVAVFLKTLPIDGTRWVASPNSGWT